jgi:hypothetical protein
VKSPAGSENAAEQYDRAPALTQPKSIALEIILRDSGITQDDLVFVIASFFAKNRFPLFRTML